MWMNRKYLAALAVAMLAITAGCAGILGDNGDSTSPIDDGTDTDSPDVDQSEFEYPTGASADGLEAERVFEGHERSFAEINSVTVNSTQSFEAPDGDFTTTGVAQFEDEMGVLEETQPSGTQEKWTDGNDVYVQNTVESDSRTHLSDLPFSADRQFDTFQLQGIIDNAEFEAVEFTTMNGESVAKYESTTVDTDGLSEELFPSQDIGDASATVYIGESGLIHSYEFSTEVSQAGEMNDFTISNELTAVDSTTVESPAWVAEAGDTAVAMSVDQTDSYLALTMESGESIPADAEFSLSSGEQQELPLTDSFDQGDTLYVYMQDGEIETSYTEPTGSTQAVGGYGTFFTGSENQVLAYEFSVVLP